MPGFNTDTIEKLGEIERRCREMREAGQDVTEGKPGALSRLRAILGDIRDGADQMEREGSSMASGEGNPL